MDVFDAKKALSRRQFVRGVGAAGATVVAASVMGCQGIGGKSSGLLPDTWDMEADVVICGIGTAGLGGAFEAAAAGGSCIILEKQPKETAGGDSMCNGGLYVPMVAGEGFLEPANRLWGSWPPERIKATSAEAATLGDYLDQGGVQWAVQADVSMIKGGGPAYYEALMTSFGELDGRPEVHYETPVKSLIVNPETREVVGVFAEQDGKRIAVKAKKGVLLATGGYAADKELVRSLDFPGIDLPHLGSPYCNGEGLRMAGDIGAALGNIWRGVEYDTFVSKAATKANKGNGVFVAESLTHPSMIYVNQKGKRYMDEAFAKVHWKNDTPPWLSYVYSDRGGTVINEGYVNDPAFLIVDNACFSRDCLGNQKSFYSYTRWSPTEGYLWSADNKVELDEGWIIKSDTIEGLATAIGLDPTTTSATVATYNQYCANGADADFGRSATTLLPVAEGPYYAIEISSAIVYTINGLVNDEHSRTLDWYGQPIPRLYSAGNIGQGGALMPIGLAGCFGAGRLAVRHAATLEPWDSGESA